MSFLYRNFKIRLANKGKNVIFGFLSRVLEPSTFEGHNKIGKFSIFKGELGRYSYIGDNAVVLGKVGRYTSIANGVKVISGRHPLREPYVSTHPVFYAKHCVVGETFVKEQLFDEYLYVKSADGKAYSAIIGNDCWIGEGASIIGGIIISDGAVVLANATVTKDVPPYAIVAGVPAKVIGFRYDEQTINSLLAKQWWNKDDSELKEKVLLFSDIKQFLDSF